MRRRTLSIRIRGALAVIAIIISASGCEPSPLTSARIERAIAPTFANLVQVQVSWLGLPPMKAAGFAVTARCRKLAGSNAGAGEWVCALAWLDPNGRPLRDTYDLFVSTDGCYTATVDGENLGGPTLEASDGREVRNLLYTLEGCFDTT